VGDERRALPDQASLRYLKVEAKRRVAAGEFPALHHAQLAIAREHGQQSWVDAPFAVQGRLAGQEVMAVTERRPPYRLAGVRLRDVAERISDPRTGSPGTVASGGMPGPVTARAEAAIGKFGLVGLALAGGRTSCEKNWTTATGWADLERAEPLATGHAFPAQGHTMVVTAVAVLRLAAGGRLRLDNPANRYLTSVRLADDEVTVRDLLAHTGGVSGDPRSRARLPFPPWPRSPVRCWTVPGGAAHLTRPSPGTRRSAR
jgi:Beta-lactamase